MCRVVHQRQLSFLRYCWLWWSSHALLWRWLLVSYTYLCVHVCICVHVCTCVCVCVWTCMCVCVCVCVCTYRVTQHCTTQCHTVTLTWCPCCWTLAWWMWTSATKPATRPSCWRHWLMYRLTHSATSCWGCFDLATWTCRPHRYTHRHTHTHTQTHCWFTETTVVRRVLVCLFVCLFTCSSICLSIYLKEQRDSVGSGLFTHKT